MDLFTLRTFTHVYFTGGSSRSRAVVCQWLKTAVFNFDLSIFELRYNEVYCHSLKLYAFLSAKIIRVSQNLDYCSGKVTHFLKYPTVTVKIIPSLLKFQLSFRENKAFIDTLITWKSRSVYQFGANKRSDTLQTHFEPSNKLF